jgi:hypothetical protein
MVLGFAKATATGRFPIIRGTAPGSMAHKQPSGTPATGVLTSRGVCVVRPAKNGLSVVLQKRRSCCNGHFSTSLFEPVMSALSRDDGGMLWVCEPTPHACPSSPRWQGEAGTPMTIESLPTRGRPPEAAARRADLEKSSGSCNTSEPLAVRLALQCL